MDSMVERHREYFERLRMDRNTVNEIFEMMAEYCRRMEWLMNDVEEKYPKFIRNRLLRQEK